MAKLVTGVVFFCLGLVTLLRNLSNLFSDYNIYFVLIEMAIGVTLFCFGWRDYKIDRAIKLIAKYITELVKIDNLKESNENPYITGRAVPITRTANFNFEGFLENTVHKHIFSLLPKDIRASKPDEIGIIVWLDWEEYQVGTYNYMYPANIGICNITIIDRNKHAIISRRKFMKEPPESVATETIEDMNSGISSTIALTPSWHVQMCSDIANYLKSLPRKA